MHRAVKLIGQQIQNLPLPVKPRDTLESRRHHAHAKMRLAGFSRLIMTGVQMRLVNNFQRIGRIGGGEFFFYSVAYHFGAFLLRQSFGFASF